jgi:hypothetical protein
MRTRLSAFEEFVALLENLKSAAHDSPERLVGFFDQSEAIRRAVQAFETFLRRTDFERRVFYGPRKHFGQVPAPFQAAWDDYQRRWAGALAHLFLRVIEPAADFDPGRSVTRPEPEPPEPADEDSFDPLWHDGGAALELGIDYLRFRADTDPIDDDQERIVNSCNIACGAYDYLVNTIGLEIAGTFRRWRKAPIVFMPAHVSNRYGASDKGGLPHLLDDAMRAYVFGAPAAAFAMCRAAFEMILKRHYGEGEWEDPKEKLARVMAIAEKRGFIKREEIKPLIERADGILHRYSQEAVLSAEDERTILIFLATLKSLIERAPKP